MLKRTKPDAIYELRQIAQALSLASKDFFDNEIAHINLEIKKIMASEEPAFHLDVIIAHLIMGAKINGQNPEKPKRA